MGASAMGGSVGNNNTAVGTGAMLTNEGYFNTATGAFALSVYGTGGDNTANGALALAENTYGYRNTGMGENSLRHNSTGASNTALGYSALCNPNSTDPFLGSDNIGIGSNAGSLVTGSLNIAIGNSGVGSESGTIRIGTQNTHTATYIAGISGATATSGVAVYVDSNGHLGTLTSSAKFKREIRPIDNASDAILSLKPVTFRYKPDLDPAGITQFGLVAEEVEKVDPDLVAHDAKGGIYTVRYEAVNAMLLNEFLKEHQRIKAQSQTIADQQKEIRALSSRLNEMSTLLQKVASKLDERQNGQPFVRNAPATLAAGAH